MAQTHYGQLPIWRDATRLLAVLEPESPPAPLCQRAGLLSSVELVIFRGSNYPAPTGHPSLSKEGKRLIPRLFPLIFKEGWRAAPGWLDQQAALFS